LPDGQSLSFNEETPNANLSRGMRHLNRVYTQKFNRSHHQLAMPFKGALKEA